MLVYECGDARCQGTIGSVMHGWCILCHREQLHGTLIPSHDLPEPCQQEASHEAADYRKWSKDMARPEDAGEAADGAGAEGADETAEGSRPSATAPGAGLSYREVGVGS